MLFWSLIIITTIIVTIVVLRPLFRAETNASTDEEQLRISIYRENLQELDKEYERGLLNDNQLVNVKHELELSLLKETTESVHTTSYQNRPGYNRLVVLIVGILIIAGSFPLYQIIGNPQLNALKQFGSSLADNEQDDPPPLQEVMVEMEEHLKKNPDDGNGWLLLANVYTAVGNYEQAVAAYESLHQLAGDSPELLLQYVNALVRISDGSFLGKPTELLQRILQADPDNYTAQFFSGLAADEAGNYKLANDYYRKIVPALQNNPELLQTVNFLITRNEQLMSMTEPEMQASADTPEQSSASLALHVSVTDELQGKYAADDTLFVYAQALEGSPMPLAVVRTRAGDLPTDLKLDDSMAMTPAMKLSAFDKVKLLARISKSGNAQPEPGDLSGVVTEVNVSNSEIISLVIDTIVP